MNARAAAPVEPSTTVESWPDVTTTTTTGEAMLTRTQIDAIHEHVALDEPIRRLINLARTDLYIGPLAAESDEDEDPYPGFIAACRMIGEAMPRSDLYIVDDEVIGDIEPLLDDNDGVLCVDSRLVVRLLVGAELARCV